MVVLMWLYNAVWKKHQFYVMLSCGERIVCVFMWILSFNMLNSLVFCQRYFVHVFILHHKVEYLFIILVVSICFINLSAKLKAFPSVLTTDTKLWPYKIKNANILCAEFILKIKGGVLFYLFIYIIIIIISITIIIIDAKFPFKHMGVMPKICLQIIISSH